MKISELYIYPVKSLAGIAVTSARVLEKGLEMDRRWMVVDENNQFMTQRIYPKMALIKTTLKEGVLSLQSSDSSIEVNPVDKSSLVTVWNDSFKASESADEVNKWISDQLKTHCRLVFMNEKQVVRTKMDHALSFADGYPYLFLGRSSMDDLNQRLKQPLSILRFRPNIVFAGGEPFEEDFWHEFQVGNVFFQGVKPCVRCALPTVDPETAEKGVEPLKTLASFRKTGNEISFGLNAFAKTKGIISIGDHVSIKDKH